MRKLLIFLSAMLVMSCSKTEDAVDTSPTASASADAALASSVDKALGASPNWELLSSGEGVSLALGAAGKQAILRLFCPIAGNRLKVNIQSFRPIGSEERLTIGTGKYANFADACLDQLAP